ncbi:hypothetical protein [Acrocarpospora sp. B8E8]|uniref:hypothetical protein n=1 Tax=Acrocarpospora sp. B8E8 TaxID=3153572 RepID=UPI00325C6409
MKSYKVRFWNIYKKSSGKQPYVVRWVVNGKVFPQCFTTSALADSFRSGLVQAARNGEAFDTETGLPESMTRATIGISWYEHALDYVDSRWNKVSGKQRISIAETLTAVTPVLVKDRRGIPDPAVLRMALYRWAHGPGISKF